MLRAEGSVGAGGAAGRTARPRRHLDREPGAWGVESRPRGRGPGDTGPPGPSRGTPMLVRCRTPPAGSGAPPIQSRDTGRDTQQLSQQRGGHETRALRVIRGHRRLPLVP